MSSVEGLPDHYLLLARLTEMIVNGSMARLMSDYGPTVGQLV